MYAAQPLPCGVIFISCGLQSTRGRLLPVHQVQRTVLGAQLTINGPTVCLGEGRGRVVVNEKVSHLHVFSVPLSSPITFPRWRVSTCGWGKHRWGGQHASPYWLLSQLVRGLHGLGLAQPTLTDQHTAAWGDHLASLQWLTVSGTPEEPRQLVWRGGSSTG